VLTVVVKYIFDKNKKNKITRKKRITKNHHQLTEVAKQNQKEERT